MVEETQILDVVKRNGCACRGLICRENNGKLAYFSIENGRRYGAGLLEFRGSERQFRRACIAYPPDMRESFTDSGSWVPTTEKKYEDMLNLI